MYKVSVLLCSILAFSASLFSQGLEGVFVEKIPVSAAAAEADDDLNTNSVAYRVFVDMASDYKLSGVLGSKGNPLLLKTTTQFYNNFLAQNYVPIYVPAPSMDDPIYYDSWLALGSYALGEIVPLEKDTEDAAQDGLIMTGKTVSVTVDPANDFAKYFGYNMAPGADGTSGGWDPENVIYFTFGGTPGYGDENVICIGQFTTDGEFSMEISVNLSGPEGGETWVLRGKFNDDHRLHNDLGYPGDPPSVSLISPVEGQSLALNEKLALTAEAESENAEITEVSFEYETFGGKKIKILDLEEAPFSYEWEVSSKDITKILAIALDSNFKRDTAIANVVVNNFPEITLTSPTDGAEYELGEEITLSADASDSDSDGSVTKVEFFINDTKIGEDTDAPYSIAWTSEAGVKEITAVATDNLGAQTTTDVVTITVVAPGNNNPEVNISSPQNGITVNEGEELKIEVSASDPDEDDFITKVEFFIKGNEIGEDLEAPWELNWKVQGIGDSEVKVKAYDNNGGSAESAPISVNINSKPLVSLTYPIEPLEIFEGDTIVITATASDSEGSISKVQFLFDGELKFEDLEEPYEFEWIADTVETIEISALAFDDLNAMNTTASVSLTVKQEVGIPSFTDSDRFRVYPNPAKGTLNLEIRDIRNQAEIYYSITNLLGEQIFNGKVNSELVSIDISAYPKGMYILSLWSADKSMAYKKSMIILFEE